MRFNATLPDEELRADLCRRINAERDRRLACGLALAGHTFQIDPTSLDRMARAVDRGDPAVQWRTTDNEWVEFSHESLSALLGAARDYVDVIALCAMKKKDAVIAAEKPDPSTVKADWPAANATEQPLALRRG